MEYTQEQIDAMKTLILRHKNLTHEVMSSEDTHYMLEFLNEMAEAIKTLSKPMKDSLEGLSV